MCGIPFAVLGVLSSLATFTKFLSDYQNLIVTLFGISIPILYVIGLWSHTNTLDQHIKSSNAENKKLRRKLKRKSKAYQDLKANRDGLINQHSIDQKDKRILYDRISQYQQIINLLVAFLPQKKIPKATEKIRLLKELSDFDQDNENSQNN